MNAQFSQIERRDTGPSFLDRTADHLYLVQQAEDELVGRLTNAVYRPDYGTVLLTGKRQWIADVLEVTDYPGGPSVPDLIHTIILAARANNPDARNMVKTLVVLAAKHAVEVPE